MIEYAFIFGIAAFFLVMGLIPILRPSALDRVGYDHVAFKRMAWWPERIKKLYLPVPWLFVLFGAGWIILGLVRLLA